MSYQTESSSRREDLPILSCWRLDRIAVEGIVVVKSRQQTSRKPATKYANLQKKMQKQKQKQKAKSGVQEESRQDWLMMSTSLPAGSPCLIPCDLTGLLSVPNEIDIGMFLIGRPMPAEIVSSVEDGDRMRRGASVSKAA